MKEIEKTDLSVDAFRLGDSHAFDIVFNKYFRAIYFFAFKYVKQHLIAEDIASDSLIKLWKKRGRINDESDLKNYLYRIVYNSCLRWLERQKTKEKVYRLYRSKDVDMHKCFIEDLIQIETIRQVKKAIDELPPQCKKVFLKLYIDEKTVIETATELNIAISTVKNQKVRGIKLIRRKLGFF